MKNETRWSIGSRLGIINNWLYEHGFSGRLWPVFEFIRKIGEKILPPRPDLASYNNILRNLYSMAEQEVNLEKDWTPEVAKQRLLRYADLVNTLKEYRPDYLVEVVLAVGDPFDGIHLIGPVIPNDPDLDEYIDVELKDKDWWYAPLTSLQDARARSNYITWKYTGKL